MQARRLSPGQFFVEQTPGPDATTVATAAPSGGVELDARIRSAYRTLAVAPNGWVGLADLRAALGHAGRAEVDSALVRLARQPGVRLIPVANLKSLTARDRDAAIRVGGEDNHVIAIEAS